MYCKGDWKILQLVLRCFLPMCYLLFWLLGLVLLASLFFSWLSIESSWSSRVQRVSLWTLRIRYCCALLFCFFISFASLFRCFSFSRVLCFCHFAFAFLFSLIFTSMSCGIIFIYLLVGSGVVVVHAAFWVVSVNVVTACSMFSGVFNGMLQIILLSIISLKVCRLVVLLHSISGLLQSIGLFLYSIIMGIWSELSWRLGVIFSLFVFSPLVTAKSSRSGFLFRSVGQ